MVGYGPFEAKDGKTWDVWYVKNRFVLSPRNQHARCTHLHLGAVPTLPAVVSAVISLHHLQQHLNCANGILAVGDQDTGTKGLCCMPRVITLAVVTFTTRAICVVSRRVRAIHLFSEQ